MKIGGQYLNEQDQRMIIIKLATEERIRQITTENIRDIIKPH